MTNLLGLQLQLKLQNVLEMNPRKYQHRTNMATNGIYINNHQASGVLTRKDL